MPRTLSDRRAYLIVTLFWVVAILAIDPRGNFPLDDDWSYARAVETFSTTGTIRLTDFTSVPLLPQILWGALFCLPAGFSFTALRLSTLILGWWGSLGVFVLMREIGASPQRSLLAALTIAACPIYLSLSLTFMTDVPFTAVAVWGIVFVCRFLRTHKPIDYTGALCCLTYATMTRQIGLSLAVGAGIAIAVTGDRRTTWAAVSMPLVSGLGLVLYPHFLHRVPLLYSLQFDDLRSGLSHGLVAILARAARRAGQIFLYVGTFLVPVAAWLWRDLSTSARRATIAVAGVASVAVLMAGIRMPVSGNVLNDLTLLPLIIANAGNRPHAPVWVWVIVTIVGLVSACVVTAHGLVNGRSLFSDPGRKGERAVAGFLLLIGVLYVAPFLLSRLYDRYLLIVFVMAMAVAAAIEPREDGGSVESGSRWMAAGSLVFLALFSIGATHDAFALNRARWAAVAAALTAGVPPDRIDGGFEVNGWLSYDAGRGQDHLIAWWSPKVDPEVLLALAPVDDYVTERTDEFQRWVPWQRAAVFSLRRKRQEQNRRGR